MVGHHSKKAHRPAVVWFRRIILGLLAVILSCACMGGLFYFWWNFESIRANFVAGRAEKRVEQIYTRTRDAVPDGVMLAGEEKPQADSYALGLSAGADRYACVRAQQIYLATAAFSEVSAAYKATFVNWGWVNLPLNNDTGLLDFVFRHPDDENLWVGLCSPVEIFHPTALIQYIVFFDFDEGPDCDGPRLACIAARYCK